MTSLLLPQKREKKKNESNAQTDSTVPGESVGERSRVSTFSTGLLFYDVALMVSLGGIVKVGNVLIAGVV